MKTCPWHLLKIGDEQQLLKAAKAAQVFRRRSREMYGEMVLPSAFALLKAVSPWTA